MRAGRHGRWVMAAMAAVVAVVLGAWLGPPLLVSHPRAMPLAADGPASVEALAELLVVPEGSGAGSPEAVSVDELAARTAPEQPDREARALRAKGVRWSTAVAWTGPAGPGTLRLTQFRWPSGAQQHLAARLLRERHRPTAEEWSVPAVPGAAALFATESTATGRVVRGLLGQGAVVAEAEFSSADPGAHEGMMALLERLAGALPGPRWPADTAPTPPPDIAPMDIAPLLLPVPAEGTMHHAPHTLWLLGFGADFYADDRAGQHHLEQLGFKRAAVVGWNEAGGDTYVLVSLLRFGADGARDWATTTADADAAARPTEDTGTVPDIDDSRYLVYRSRPETHGRYGEAVLFRHQVAVMVQVYGAGASRERLIALAAEQYARLP